MDIFTEGMVIRILKYYTRRMEAMLEVGNIKMYDYYSDRYDALHYEAYGYYF